MPRKASPVAAPVETDFDRPEVSAAVTEIQQQGGEHALAVAQMFDAPVEYRRDAAMARLRGLMAAGTQVMLEIGSHLAWVREHEPEAEFDRFVAEAGLERRAALRLMQAAVKFRLSLSGPQAEAMQRLNRSKLYELLILDDDEVRALADGGTVAGMTLEDVDTMSTSELRTALRAERAKAKQDLAVKDKLLTQKNERIDRVEADLETYRSGAPDVDKRAALERERAAQQRLMAAALQILGDVAELDAAIADVMLEPTAARSAMAESTLQWVFQRLADAAHQHGWQCDPEAAAEPAWLAEMNATKKAA